MSRVEKLIKSRGNLSVKFMEFTRIVSKGRYAVFFEGEDEKYYSIRINSIRPDIEWSGINGGGKSNVIELRGKIRKHETYADALCMFFVDADFDDNSEFSDFSDTYVTPCYSVENFYISLDAFIRILSAEFGINDSRDNEQCYVNCIKNFQDTKSEYLNSIKYFNFLIRELRLMERKGELEGSLNINNINFENLVRVDLGVVEKVYDEKKPKSIFSDLREDMIVDLNGSEKHFKDLPGDLWFRGKQNLEFFRVFIEKLKFERCRKGARKIFKDKGVVKLQMSKGNCISEISQYADTPSCLKKFLEVQKSVLHAA